MFFVRAAILALWTAISFAMLQTPVSQLNWFGTILGYSFGIAAPMLYFLPSYEANRLKHVNQMSILVINFFLGWSLIGWVIAAVWAHRKSESSVPASVPNHEAERSIAASDRKTKACPFCGEDVLIQAIKCKHCHSDLSSHVPPMSA